MKKLLLLLAVAALMLPAFTACSEKEEVQPKQEIDMDALRAEEENEGTTLEYEDPI